MALNPRAREAGADTPSSVSRPTRSSRLGGASPISFSSNSFSRYSDSGAHDGARAFGADADDDGVVAAASMMMVWSHEALPASYGVNRRQAALKDQRFMGARLS